MPLACMSDVVVSIDNDGVVTYSVTGASFDEAKQLQEIALRDDFATQITESLIENGSDITVQSTTSDEEIEVFISATVDTTDGIDTVDAIISIESMAESYGLPESTVEGITMIFW